MRSPPTKAAARRSPHRSSPRRARDVRQAAQARLRRFRAGSALAVALTGLLLVSGGLAETDAGAPAEPVAPGEAIGEAAGTLGNLARSALGLLPKLAVALAVLTIAALLARLARRALRGLLSSWTRADAVSALVSVAIWLLAFGSALSVLAGDPRALVGSVGLAGLALSWALQAPIESFTGWLLNSFRGYYRVGDRIAVGEVFGDVHRIDVLTTTLWEAGGPGKNVRAAQTTGALVTFPNSEVLRANIINYTRDFPYLWDELTIGITLDSDLPRALEVLRAVADRVVGDAMAEAARDYARILAAQGLAAEAALRPEAYASPTDAWLDVTIRYLVPVRERRRWSTRLLLAFEEALADPEHAGHIRGAVPRQEVRLTE